MKEPHEASVRELLSHYQAILVELRRRDVVRTSNAPTGDYAEYLMAEHLGGELAPNSEKSWDVGLPDGARIQVKARVVGDGLGRGVRQLSVIRSWDFDTLAVVLFGDGYSVARGALIPAKVAREQARYVSHVNGYRLIASDQLMSACGSVDITEALGMTAARL